MKKYLTLLTLISLMIAQAEPARSVYEVPLQTLDGKDASLKDYQGKVLLVVNVASKCGYTKQYAGLQALHARYAAKGFSVLGFPCNDFGAQEPGTAEEIKAFCTTTYQVTFPLFAKLHVKGAEQHPLYAVLTGKDSPFPGDISWNFNKFLIGKDGKILKRFESKVAPESSELIEAVEAALAAK